MTSELQQQLYKKYPKIFVQKDQSMQVTAMCWGFECGDGWYKIIDALCEHIQNHVDWENQSIKWKKERGELPQDAPDFPQIEAVQVKEKFGGLRFYTNLHDEFIDGVIAMAESMSFMTCEDCGNPGEPNKGGWIVTLCQPCRDDYNKKMQQREEEAKARLTVKMNDVTIAP